MAGNGDGDRGGGQGERGERESSPMSGLCSLSSGQSSKLSLFIPLGIRERGIRIGHLVEKGRDTVRQRKTGEAEKGPGYPNIGPVRKVQSRFETSLPV